MVVALLSNKQREKRREGRGWREQTPAARSDVSAELLRDSHHWHVVPNSLPKVSS